MFHNIRQLLASNITGATRRKSRVQNKIRYNTKYEARSQDTEDSTGYGARSRDIALKNPKLIDGSQPQYRIYRTIDYNREQGSRQLECRRINGSSSEFYRERRKLARASRLRIQR